jgi:hypothetical protein
LFSENRWFETHTITKNDLTDYACAVVNSLDIEAEDVKYYFPIIHSVIAKFVLSASDREAGLVFTPAELGSIIDNVMKHYISDLRAMPDAPYGPLRINPRQERLTTIRDRIVSGMLVTEAIKNVG